jgi:uncharacterized protein
MFDKYKPIDTTPATLTPIAWVMTAQWLLLLALFLVFAHDFSIWSDAGQPAWSWRVQPIAHATLAVSRSLGIVQARDAVQEAVYSVYDNPLTLAGAAHVGARRDTSPASHGLTTRQPEMQANLLTASGRALPQPQRVLIVGASSIQEELGIAIERAVKKYEGVEVQRLGRISSGLARPDYFDWPDKLQELLDQYHPDLVIAQWGGNDCQSLSSKDGSVIANYGTAEWDAEYTRRVKTEILQMHDAGANVVFIGMPYMKNPNFSNKIAHMNQITEAACNDRGAVYLPLWDLTVDEQGKLKASVTIDGKQRMMRLSDGIHFSEAGAEYVAGKLCERMAKYFTLVTAK